MQVDEFSWPGLDHLRLVVYHFQVFGGVAPPTAPRYHVLGALVFAHEVCADCPEVWQTDPASLDGARSRLAVTLTDWLQIVLDNLATKQMHEYFM